MAFSRPTIDDIKADYIAAAVSNFPEASAILDWSNFSIIRGHSLAFVVMTDKLYENLEQARNDIWYDTASEDALEQHLEDKGLTRGVATKASGTVRIGSTTLPTSTITIPGLFQVSTSDETPIVFETDEQVTISPATPVDGLGYYTVEVDVTAFQAGSDGNTVQGAINTVVTSLAGVNIVYSTTVTGGGTDEESIASMRERLKNVITPAPHTKSWYITEASNFAFIKDAYVECSSEGNGHVNIFLAGVASLSPAQIQEVEDYFNDPEQSECVANVVTASEVMDVPINITINVYRTDTSVDVTTIQNAIDGFFTTLGVKEDFVLSACAGYIRDNVDYIYDITFTLPTANVVINAGEVATLNTLNVNLIDTTND